MRKMLLAAALALLAVRAGAAERIVYEADSLYHHILVSESSGLRILRFRKGSVEDALHSSFAQTIISLEDPYALYMHYSKHCMVGAAAVEKPERVCFVGLGGGSLPKFFARLYPGCRIDVAELDAKVVEVARRFFFLPQIENMNINVVDGRVFLRETEKKYDLIFLDAYRDQMIPFHLMTLDFFEELKSKLAPGGLLVSNVALRESSQLYPWLLRTYQSAFPALWVADVPGTINKVFLAANEPETIDGDELVEKSEKLAAKHDLGFDLPACAARFKDVSKEEPSDRVLTDDYAPVNLMRLRQADEKDWEY